MYLKGMLFSSFVIAATFMMLNVSSSFAGEIPVNPELYGSWNALDLEQSGMKVNLILIIEENQIIARNTCSFRVQCCSPNLLSSSDNPK